MIEFAQGFFNLEHPAADASLPAGRHVLRGWLVGKPNEVLVDLRIRCAGQIWPAVYGFIRPDLAAHFKSGSSQLPAAFEATVFLNPGASALEFEALGISGHWIPVYTRNLMIAPGPDAAFTPDPEAPVNAAEFNLLLQQLLRAQAEEPGRGLGAHAAQLAQSLPCPRYLHHPSPPFRAFFREPAIITRAAYGRLLVDGYLFHEQLPVQRVLATFDLQVWQVVAHGGISPIAPQLYPHCANAVHSNVKGYVEVPSQLPRPLTLRLYAEMADGTRHLCCVQQTTTFGVEDEKKPYPPASVFLFLRAVRALSSALRIAGLALDRGPTWRQTLWSTWRNFSQRAPRRAKPVPCLAPGIPDGPARPLNTIFVFTQNLDREGAPLLLLEYCRHLIQPAGAKLTVISASDGPLRENFVAAGAAVRIVDATPLTRAVSAQAWRAGLNRLAAEINCAPADLIVANTLASYWGIHLAHQAGKPSLFYIHESTTPAAFYHGTAAPAVVPFAEASFSLATRVSFNSVHTSRYYEPLATRANYYLNPGWIDRSALAAHRARHPRNELRARLGVPAGQRLVLNLGAVCERKGQHVFAWAVDLLWRREPALAATSEFWMVGGRRTPFDDSMAALLASLDRPNLRLIPETDRPYDYLGAADLFVCSSYEESFPRVVLEAMALGLPIVSTTAHGVTEMVRHEQEALLVPTGDSSALADAMARMLREPHYATELAARAQARLETHFDSAIVLPRQVNLAHHVIAAHDHGV